MNMTTTDNINIWKIVHSIDNNEYINSIDVDQNKKTHLLDLSKDAYCLLEKFVYDTAQFHFNRLNITMTNNTYIEFWCKNKFASHALHVDCDEYQKKTNLNYSYPLLSCVTYFNDNMCPTIITNVDLEAYKYKKFETQDTLFFSLPKCNKQITFNGSFYHGSSLIGENTIEDSRYIIAINLWDKKPDNVDYYNNSNILTPLFNKQEQLVTINKELAETCILNIKVCSKILNYQLFEDLLYQQHKQSCFQFGKLMQNALETKTNNNISSYTFTLEKTVEQQLSSQLKNKYSDIMVDIAEITDETTVFKYNRFLQRFHYTKIYTPDICRFIINECEKYASQNNGWTTKRHHNYPTTDIPVDKISSIFGLILETMNSIVTKIKKSYGLGDDISVNVSDLFVVKYSVTAQNNLDMHCDGSFLSFNILLSDVLDFEGGGTYFDDGLTHYPEQGDILIHSSKIKHSGLTITKRTRYLLVGFLNLM